MTCNLRNCLRRAYAITWGSLRGVQYGFNGCLREPTRCRLCLRGHGFFLFSIVAWGFGITNHRYHIANQGKMNEFNLLPTSVYTKATLLLAKTSLRQCLRKLLRLHVSPGLGQNISCGVPTLSILLRYSKTLNDSNRWDMMGSSQVKLLWILDPLRTKRIPQGRTGISQTTRAEWVSEVSSLFNLHLCIIHKTVTS